MYTISLVNAESATVADLVSRVAQVSGPHIYVYIFEYNDMYIYEYTYIYVH